MFRCAYLRIIIEELDVAATALCSESTSLLDTPPILAASLVTLFAVSSGLLFASKSTRRLTRLSSLFVIASQINGDNNE